MNPIGNLLKISLNALKDPVRQELVAKVSENLMVAPSLTRIRQRMLMTESGRQILREHPLINSKTINLNALRELPEQTFGRQYVKFLDSEMVSPDTRAPMQYLPNNDEELGYILLRYRQTHDFMHTLLGVPTTLKGELALKWFEFVQTGIPMTLFAGLIGPLRLSSVWKFQDLRSAGSFNQSINSKSSDIGDFYFRYLPWAIQSGQNADLLISVYWEKHFNEDLLELQKRHGIITFNDYLSKNK